MSITREEIQTDIDRLEMVLKSIPAYAPDPKLRKMIISLQLTLSAYQKMLPFDEEPEPVRKWAIYPNLKRPEQVIHSGFSAGDRYRIRQVKKMGELECQFELVDTKSPPPNNLIMSGLDSEDVMGRLADPIYELNDLATRTPYKPKSSAEYHPRLQQVASGVVDTIEDCVASHNQVLGDEVPLEEFLAMVVEETMARVRALARHSELLAEKRLLEAQQVQLTNEKEN